MWLMIVSDSPFPLNPCATMFGSINGVGMIGTGVSILARNLERPLGVVEPVRQHNNTSIYGPRGDETCIWSKYLHRAPIVLEKKPALIRHIFSTHSVLLTFKPSPHHVECSWNPQMYLLLVFLPIWNISRRARRELLIIFDIYEPLEFLPYGVKRPLNFSFSGVIAVLNPTDWRVLMFVCPQSLRYPGNRGPCCSES